MLRADTQQTLARRAALHGLHPRCAADDTDVTDIVDAAVALRAWPPSAAQAVVASRRLDQVPARDDLRAALTDGKLVHSYAFGGGGYLFTPGTAADVLSVRALSRQWEKPSFQRQAGFALSDWRPLRAAMRAMLADGPLSREQISSRLAHSRALRHLADAARGAGADTLYKPLHWWGDICFGPIRGGAATFAWLGASWSDIDGQEHLTRALRRHLHAYGPSTDANLEYRLIAGLSAPRAQVRRALEQLAPEMTHVLTDVGEAYLLSTDLEQLMATRSTPFVRLLPPHDPWVMSPGTGDTRIVPTNFRRAVSSGLAVVTVGGVVAGVWRQRHGGVEVTMSADSPAYDPEELAHEIDRCSS